MTEQNLPTIMNTGLNIETVMRLDKQDIVNVAIAKIESRLRNQIKGLSGQIVKLTEELTKAGEMILATGIKALDLHQSADMINTKCDAVIELLGKDKFAIDVTDQIPDRNAILQARRTKNQTFNSRSYLLSPINGRGGITLDSITIPVTGTQIALMNEADRCEKDIASVNSEIVGLKRKLSDMPAMERQIRARVVEAELNKSDNGKGLLESLTGQIDEMINLIG